MACTNPLTGWRAKHLNKNGNRPIVFNKNDGFLDMEVTVPCGRCTSCRLEHSRQWAVRCMHEAQMHEGNSFITLTYAPEHLPEDYSVHKKELQKFFKRLRKNTGIKLRYFACGEYGDENRRPHYHAIIFGYDFPDKELYTKTRTGDLLYRSPLLEKTWKYGFSLIGGVSFESAAYVARYVMKKRKGDPDQVDPKTGLTNKEYYETVDPDTGEIHDVQPEFCLMSRNRGIGHTWFEQFKSDTDKDYLTIRGHKMAIPKYYDQLLRLEDIDSFTKRKSKRKNKINHLEQLPARMEARKIVINEKVNKLYRQL